MGLAGSLGAEMVTCNQPEDPMSTGNWLPAVTGIMQFSTEHESCTKLSPRGQNARSHVGNSAQSPSPQASQAKGIPKISNDPF